MSRHKDINISDNIYRYIMEMEWQKTGRHALQRALRASPGQILARHTPQCLNGSAAADYTIWTKKPNYDS